MENLRTSSYLIDVKLDNTDKYMLIHGYTGAIDVVNEKVALSLKNSPEDFLKEDTPFSGETIEALQKRGYLTEKTQEEEYAYVARMADALHRKDKILQKGFTFVVTYDCNFRCPYCFEAGVAQDEMRKKVFTKEMVDKVYDAILQIEPNENLRPKSITLYGGEPLLRENREVVEYMVQKGKELDFRFSAITNGYDLDAYEDLLSPDTIMKLQITIDGVRERHNKRRIHYANNETFDKIIGNIGLALDKEIYVTIRVNTDKNNFSDLQKLKSLFDELHYTENSKFRIDSALLRNYNGMESGEGNLSFLSQKEFIQRHTDLNFEYGCHDFGALRKLQNSITNNKPLTYCSTFCAAQTSGYVFDPVGRIYPCWEVVGKSNFLIGNYESEAIQWNKDILNRWQNHNVSTSPKCVKCKYSLLCGGGCFALLIRNPNYCTNYGDILKYAANMAFRKVNK